MNSFSPSFSIGSIRIGTIEGASCVNFGNNFPTGFTSHKRQNQGFGSINGDHNDINDILSRLDVKDVIEAFHQSQNEEVPEWIERLLKDHLDDTEIIQDKDEET